MNQELITLLTILPGLLEKDCSLTAYNEFIRTTLEKARTFDKRSLTHKKYGTEELCPVYVPLSREHSTSVPISSLTEEELKYILNTKECLRLGDEPPTSLEWRAYFNEKYEKKKENDKDKCMQQ